MFNRTKVTQNHRILMDNTYRFTSNIRYSVEDGQRCTWCFCYLERINYLAENISKQICYLIKGRAINDQSIIIPWNDNQFRVRSEDSYHHRPVFAVDDSYVCPRSGQHHSNPAPRLDPSTGFEWKRDLGFWPKSKAGQIQLRLNWSTTGEL
jgi:hypothetical protein